MCYLSSQRQSIEFHDFSFLVPKSSSEVLSIGSSQGKFSTDLSWSVFSLRTFWKLPPRIHPPFLQCHSNMCKVSVICSENSLSFQNFNCHPLLMRFEQSTNFHLLIDFIFPFFSFFFASIFKFNGINSKFSRPFQMIYS